MEPNKTQDHEHTPPNHTTAQGSATTSHSFPGMEADARALKINGRLTGFV